MLRRKIYQGIKARGKGITRFLKLMMCSHLSLTSSSRSKWFYSKQKLSPLKVPYLVQGQMLINGQDQNLHWNKKKKVLNNCRSSTKTLRASWVLLTNALSTTYTLQSKQTCHWGEEVRNNIIAQTRQLIHHFFPTGADTNALEYAIKGKSRLITPLLLVLNSSEAEIPTSALPNANS